jgi:hypothetical protein
MNRKISNREEKARKGEGEKRRYIKKKLGKMI